MLTKSKNRLLKFLISLILIIILSVFVKSNSPWLNSFNQFLANILGGNPNSGLAIIPKIFVFLFSPIMDIIWTVILGIILWSKQAKIPAIWSFCVIIGGDIVLTIIKDLIKEPRPAMHLNSDSGYAFPSGHTFGIFILISLIWLTILPEVKKGTTKKIIQFISIILMISMMIIRVYLQAHFFTDTIGAVILGYTWLQISEFLYIKLSPMLTHFNLTKDSYK